MSLATSPLVPMIPTAGVRQTFPPYGQRTIELHAFGYCSIVLLSRHERWLNRGYVDMTWLPLQAARQTYRLTDRGELLREGPDGQFEALPPESIYWVDNLRFLYSRAVPGQASVWTVTWMESKPTRTAERLVLGTQEESIAITPQGAVKLAGRRSPSQRRTRLAKRA